MLILARKPGQSIEIILTDGRVVEVAVAALTPAHAQLRFCDCLPEATATPLVDLRALLPADGDGGVLLAPDVRVCVTEITRTLARMGVAAPKHVKVRRSELPPW